MMQLKAWFARPINMAMLIAIASLGACVTINIYFPPAAVEKAADKIIDEVWQLKEGEKTKSAPSPSGQQ